MKTVAQLARAMVVAPLVMPLVMPLVLLIAVIGVSLLEWITYHRRVTV